MTLSIDTIRQMVRDAEAELSAASAAVTALKRSAPDGPMGLTADSVKASPEWQQARVREAIAFRKLQEANELHVKAREASKQNA